MQKTLLTLLACLAIYFSHAQISISQANMLRLVSNQYNKRFELWDDSANKIDLDRISSVYPFAQQNDLQQSDDISDSSVAKDNSTEKRSKHNKNKKNDTENYKALDEVVITGYGKQNASGITGDYTTLKAKDFRDLPSTTVAGLIQGKVAGVEVISSSGNPIGSPQIIIRGVTSLNQPNPLYVIDGMVQPNTPGAAPAGSNINPNDIASITVLKDAAATAIYGSSAAGGVILVTTKSGNEQSGSSWINLKRQDDVEYIEEIKNAADPYNKFQQLEQEYKYSFSFYLDMAQYFYKNGLKHHVDEILVKAGKLADSADVQSQLALAFICEYTEKFDKALVIYTSLCEAHPADLRLARNLAWAYFENNKYDSAVNILYSSISSESYGKNSQTIKLKDIMLADMNMIISLHRDELHIDYIPKEIIKPIPADMRVLIEINNNGLYNLSVKRPWKHAMDSYSSVGSNKERLENASNDYSLSEFIVKNANNKPYSFTVPFHDAKEEDKTPTLVRMIKIKDFGKSTQSIDMDIANLNNQNGDVEFDEFTIAKK